MVFFSKHSYLGWASVKNLALEDFVHSSSVVDKNKTSKSVLKLIFDKSKKFHE